MMRVRRIWQSRRRVRAASHAISRLAGQQDDSRVPGFVPDDWIARYGPDAGAGSRRTRVPPARDRASRDDLWLMTVALALCGGVFGAAVAGWALSLAVPGWLAAVIVLAAVFAGGVMMARVFVNAEIPNRRDRLPRPWLSARRDRQRHCG